MSVISLQFVAFFLCVLIIYYLLPQKLQWVWLLITSGLFYCINATWIQSLIFLGFLLINWGLSQFMQPEQKHRKSVYTGALVIDILALMIFKYSRFFYQIFCSIGLVFGQTWNREALDLFVDQTELIAPARISYFALIVIGYMTDIYWGKYVPQKNIGKFALFAGYFPQMTSGPIVRYDEMQGQLFDGKKHEFDYNRVIRGLQRALWGIFKKLVISERCAIVVNAVYSYYPAYNGFYIFMAAGLFAIQLYTDFSGLMDIVLGVSEALGIALPENFATPFYSTGIAEFWRKWHITLGAWLREYVFYPVLRGKLCRNLRKFCKQKFGRQYENKCDLPTYVGLLASWFLIGLWHGGGWNYIFGVGLYMWAMIVLGELLHPFLQKLNKLLRVKTECFSWKLFQRVRTFCIFAFGLSFFRAENLKEGFAMWGEAFSNFNPYIFLDQSIYNLGLNQKEWQICLMGILALIIVSYLEQKAQVRDLLVKQNFLFRLGIFTLLFLAVIVLGYYGTDFNAADFIYGRF